VNRWQEVVPLDAPRATDAPLSHFQTLLDAAVARKRDADSPVVTLTWAQALDGSIAARRGAPTPLSGPESLRLTHGLRARHDAILVGSGTVLADDPVLTTRLVRGPSPRVVVLDTRGRCPADARCLRSREVEGVANREGSPHRPPPIVCVGPGARPSPELSATATVRTVPTDARGYLQLPAVLRLLSEEGIASVMVEGGGAVLAAFLRAGRADLMVVTVAPVLLHGYRITAGGVERAFPNARWFGVGADGILVAGDDASSDHPPGDAGFTGEE